MMVALKTRVVDDAYAGFQPEAVAAWKRRFCSEAYFRDRLRDPALETEFYLVGTHSHPVAMGALKLRDGAGYIGDLYVERRGHGLGSALLADLIDRARGRGLCKVVADAFAVNERVIGWLEGHGFTLVSTYVESSLGVPVHRFERQLAPVTSQLAEAS
jgi:ribosomal protein S18 acetylase RimI-like enzyme